MQKRTTVKTQPIRLRGKKFLPKRSTVITDAPKSKKISKTLDSDSRQSFKEKILAHECVSLSSLLKEKKILCETSDCDYRTSKGRQNHVQTTDCDYRAFQEGQKNSRVCFASETELHQMTSVRTSSIDFFPALELKGMMKCGR